MDVCLLGPCSGSEWQLALCPQWPECSRTPLQGHGASPGAARGTRSSHPRFLGDCCQVRNSKAEFIILADK